MATLVLQSVGSAAGGALGGPLGAAFGSALGGIGGGLIDNALFGGGKGGRVVHGPRLTDLNGISASEGAPIPRIYGRARVGGQVIWATEFEEEQIVERTGRSGGKSTNIGGGGGGGGGAAQTTIRYVYYANVAIGICEGPITYIRRIWADGKEIDRASLAIRYYLGGNGQEADPLIIAKQGRGDVPAFRGLAYVVFERFPLKEYGNRLPQFSFEVVRTAPSLPANIRAINLIPGSTEFGYASEEVRADFGYGTSASLNRQQWTHQTDWEAAMSAMTAMLPRLERVSVINGWFGDDVRVGECTIRPKVEKRDRVTTGQDWRIGPLTREAALEVSTVNNRPAYGGSPSDASIINVIRTLKAQGKKVALHPFILMDVPVGNGRPNPYGAGEQLPYPWRGRITCYPAPGQPDTPDNSSAVIDAINAFFGTAQPSHFTRNGDIIGYAGPDEWSYRRMVLHQAMQAQAAGGVDTFFLGSELIGLTRLAAGGGFYPAVAAFMALADDVRSILGSGTRITYAADWTEYGAHVRGGGTGAGSEVRFPLDPLWASPNVDAIAIDYYMPLTDWRPGRDHLDAAEAYSAADRDYILSRITAGEGFDWYYADDAGRAAQNRLPITDEDYGKPWVYRVKDIKSWWSNPHIERVNGVELASPTPYQPMGKPILLSEIGCPAVDKGANQPNVFPDPKSVENALPHFSLAVRDDHVQWRTIEAQIAAFDPTAPGFDPARNPISPIYNGYMIMPDFIAPWAYDARPFPTFPALTSYWADGENWSRGHWINGRIEGVPIAELLAMIFADYGLANPAFHHVEGMVDGYVVDRPMSARAAIEPILNLFAVSARAEGSGILFFGLPSQDSFTLTREDIALEKEGEVEIEITRAQESELPRAARLGFTETDEDYRRAQVQTALRTTSSRRDLSEDTALGMPRAIALARIEATLQTIWLGRETFRFSLRPNLRGLDVGDAVILETLEGLRNVLITRITDGRVRHCEGRAFDRSILEAGTSIETTRPAPPLPALPGAPHVALLELPVDRGGGAGPLLAAVRAEPWRGPYTLSRVIAEGVFEPLASAAASARLGETLTPLPPGPLWRWDHAASLDIRLEGGALASISAELALSGGNALALQGPDGTYELIACQQAELIGEKRYRLTGLLRGLALSEAASQRLLAAGAPVYVLDNALLDLGNAVGAVGSEVDILTAPSGRDATDHSAVRRRATIRGIAARPLAPVHPRAKREGAGIRLSFIRRARAGGDSWELYEIPLREEREAYVIEILAANSVKRSLELTSPDFLYTDELADFGAPQTSLSLRIRQLSVTYGPGEALVADVRVV